jgi:hypothetical protein
MAKLVGQDLDFNNSATINNLPDATQDQQPATFAQLKAQSEGMAWKDSVRAASTANINLASPGTSVDGVTLSNGDRVLVKDQTSAPENGIYIWNGSSTAMTRAADASTAAELESAIVPVEEGTTNAGTQWRQTAVNFTLGTNDVTFTSFSTNTPAASEAVAGKAEIATQAETNGGTDDSRFVTPLKLKESVWSARSMSQNIGNGSATQFDITHNWGTREVICQVIRNSGNYDEVIVDISRPDNNTVRINFASAPSSNQFKALLFKASNSV